MPGPPSRRSSAFATHACPASLPPVKGGAFAGTATLVLRTRRWLLRLATTAPIVFLYSRHKRHLSRGLAQWALRHLESWWKRAISVTRRKLAPSASRRSPCRSRSSRTSCRLSLVERRKSGVELTDQGEEIVRRARTILASVRDLVDYAKHQEGVLAGVLKLGAIPSIAPYLLPTALPDSAAAIPAAPSAVDRARSRGWRRASTRRTTRLPDAGRSRAGRAPRREWRAPAARFPRPAR